MHAASFAQRKLSAEFERYRLAAILSPLSTSGILSRPQCELGSVSSVFHLMKRELSSWTPI